MDFPNTTASALLRGGPVGGYIQTGPVAVWSTNTAPQAGYGAYGVGGTNAQPLTQAGAQSFAIQSEFDEGMVLATNTVPATETITATVVRPVVSSI